MKTYAQFFQLSTGYIPGTIPPQFGERKPIEATGDRGLIQIDGRLSLNSMHEIAESECNKRGYFGWMLLRGNALRDAKPLHAPILSQR